MRKHFAVMLALALVLAILPMGSAFAAAGDGFTFTVDSGGSYAYNQVPKRQNDPDSGFQATFVGYLDGTWTVDWTLISPDAGSYVVAAGVAGTCSGNTPLFTINAAVEDVTVSGSWGGTASPPSNFNFIRVYPSSQLCQTRWAASVDQPSGVITAPASSPLPLGSLTVGASYFDNDYDQVQWAVRYGTCAANTNTRAGNVDGFHTPYSWDGMALSATIDTSEWPIGEYCFVFNTLQDSHENDVRLTRTFLLDDHLAPTLSCPQGEMFVTSVGIGDVTPVVASDPLAVGIKYDVGASGVFYAGGRFRYDIAADAQYSQDYYQRANGLGWTDSVHNYGSYGPGLLDLEVNGTPGVWGAYSAGHTYSTTLWGDGSPATFQIYDIYAQNNTGGLCVSIDRVSPGGIWLPPIINADFALRNGSTLPIKFQVKYPGMAPFTPEQNPVYLEVHGPGGLINTWTLGDGSLKFNYETMSYLGLFRTKDFELATGEYMAKVVDVTTGDTIATYSFSVDIEKGTSRGNSGK